MTNRRRWIYVALVVLPLALVALSHAVPPVDNPVPLESEVVR